MLNKKEMLKENIKINKNIMKFSKKLINAFMAASIKGEVPLLTDAAFRIECRIFLTSSNSVIVNKQKMENL